MSTQVTDVQKQGGTTDIVPNDAWKDRALEAFLTQGIITEQMLDRGHRAAKSGDERVDLVLNKLGLINDDAYVEIWSQISGWPIIESKDFPVSPVFQDELQGSYLKFARILPFRINEDTLDIATADPLNDLPFKAIEAKTGKAVRRFLARPGELAKALDSLYNKGESDKLDEANFSENTFTTDTERLRDLASDAPVIRLVNTLIHDAIEKRASDIHITATREATRIRYRLDGLLHDMKAAPPHLHGAIISRIKIMAGLDIAEQRLPQDGRLRIVWHGREVDLRVATMPHINGEGVVLRILDRASVALDLPTLGFSETIIEQLTRVLHQPHGIFLVTGPTGSGKTTTLYAALKLLVDPSRNLLTVEDPVEYQLEGVTQIQVEQKIGLDFARVLRSVLRQDPDTIMVGEIRDRETAAIANQAALTGHFVLATLHTNTAISALPRLVDMGVEPYLLASTLRASMAQRLVRRLCTHCRKEAWTYGVEFNAFLQLPQDGFKCYEPVGCEKCQGTGYVGRSAVAEFVAMSPPLRHGLLAQFDESRMEEDARSAGHQNLWHDGFSKIIKGETSISEVLRVMGSG